MRGQEGGEGEEDDPPLVPRLGTRTGSTLLFSTTTRFSDMKQKRNYSFLTSRSIAKTSYTIRSSGVLLQTGRVFLMTFIVGVKSYMEVSNETSDKSTASLLGIKAREGEKERASALSAPATNCQATQAARRPATPTHAKRSSSGEKGPTTPGRARQQLPRRPLHYHGPQWRI